VSKVLFAPFSIAAGLLAGLLGKRVADHLWALVSEEEPPEATHRTAGLAGIVAAAALQGAVFRVVKALTDRGSRTAFYRLTGSWPGDQVQDPEP
jgi:hypothetical protein